MLTGTASENEFLIDWTLPIVNNIGRRVPHSRGILTVMWPWDAKELNY